MTVWFVRLQLDSAAFEDQASMLADNFGHAYVDEKRNRTEVIFYSAHDNIITAVNDAMNALTNFARRIGFHTSVVQVEVMSRADRRAELANEGITEENIMNLT